MIESNSYLMEGSLSFCIRCPLVNRSWCILTPCNGRMIYNLVYLHERIRVNFRFDQQFWLIFTRTTVIDCQEFRFPRHLRILSPVFKFESLQEIVQRTPFPTFLEAFS